MPWLKAGDNAATHPIVMRVAALAAGDDRAVNEAFGFVMRCALQSAGHTTDYVIEEGTAWMLGGARAPELLELARKAGYLKPGRRAGLRIWTIVDDPDFIHMRLKAEIDWERQQRADAANPALTAPVRERDGDGCRYCGRIVNWKARKGRLAGTYDHRDAGRAATVDTMVVACGSCNAGRRDREDADDRYPLRPAPDRPFYSLLTVEFLAAHGITVQPTEDATPLPAGQRNGDPAASGTTPQLTGMSAPAGSADPMPTCRDGTGRDGLVRDGTGPVGSGRDGAAPQRRKRAARGRPR